MQAKNSSSKGHQSIFFSTKLWKKKKGKIRGIFEEQRSGRRESARQVVTFEPLDGLVDLKRATITMHVVLHLHYHEQNNVRGGRKDHKIFSKGARETEPADTISHHHTYTFGSSSKSIANDFQQEKAHLPIYQTVKPYSYLILSRTTLVEDKLKNKQQSNNISKSATIKENNSEMIMPEEFDDEGGDGAEEFSDKRRLADSAEGSDDEWEEDT
ncbi:hypothetical protein Cni_G19820 [Canna indica]|uniref:Uncharacterized protein n=1 Tax=Canna indica TaxID=4628 RepID=A0AAQ3KMS3_9LILI|nr:hypothetical protein Cni_G19820 [Canna indica]